MGRMCGFHEAFSYSCVFSGLTKGVRVEINVKLTEPVVYIWGERTEQVCVCEHTRAHACTVAWVHTHPCGAAVIEPGWNSEASFILP